jgi:hypothetical protein
MAQHLQVKGQALLAHLAHVAQHQQARAGSSASTSMAATTESGLAL